MSIIFNAKNSKIDYDLEIADKEIPSPTRKRVTETVPFMSGLWDFTPDEYDAVKLKYSFDVIADSKRELNDAKRALETWLNTGTGPLYDTDISASHFFDVYGVATSWSESGLQGSLTVEFTCYPFMRSSVIESVTDLSQTAQTVTITLGGVRPIIPTIIVSGTGASASITFDGKTASLSAGTYHGGTIIGALRPGTNELTVSGSGTLTVRYWEEVFG